MSPRPLPWQFDDGGRRAAGFRGHTEDCVTRAFAIVTGRPYREVYDLVNQVAAGERTVRGRVGHAAATGRGSSARRGVLKWTRVRVAEALGLVWVPTMGIGTGTRIHLADGELPDHLGPLAVKVSKHLTAYVAGVLRDTHDPSRGGTRAVYGYYHLPLHRERTP